MDGEGMEGQTDRHEAEDSAEGGRVQGGTDGHHVWNWDGEDMEGQMDKRMGTVL